MNPALFIALALFVFGFYGFRLARRYGPGVSIKPKPIDEAFIQARVHPFRPGPHGFKAGLMKPTQDDAHVERIAAHRRVH